MKQLPEVQRGQVQVQALCPVRADLLPRVGAEHPAVPVQTLQVEHRLRHSAVPRLLHPYHAVHALHRAAGPDGVAQHGRDAVIRRLLRLGDLQLEDKLRSARERLGFDLAIQAEVIGPGIQKNKYALPAVTLRVFSVLNVEAFRLLDHGAMISLLAEMQLESVPQLGTLVLDHSVDELVAFAEGLSHLNLKIQREGVVLRPLAEEYDEDLGGRLSFKVINPKFLLKFDE